VAHERAALRKPPAAERRPPPVALHLSRVNGGGEPARQSAAAVAGFAPIAISSPVSVQCARISHPSDPAEKEAVQIARNVVQMPEPARPPPAKPEEEGKKTSGVVQRAEAVPGRAPSPLSSTAPLGGSPLPSPVRSFMEPRFGANFGNVRIHTGEAAADESAALNAQAFTVGEHVFFGRNQFQPNTGSGRELIAHELTHTIQQGAAVQRAANPSVAERTGPIVHRAGLGEPFDTFAGWANAIPGFRLLTVVLGINPINLAPVERSAINVLRGILELIPITGPLLVQALEHYGILQKAAAWIETQVQALGMAGSALTAALKEFVKSLGVTDVFSPGSVWERAKRIFTEPIARLIAVGKAAVVELLKVVREAVLLPLAKLAEGTRGYDLLKAVLGEDPVTGQPVPRTPETLIGGFLKLIGQEEIWQNLQKSHAVARAWAWFQGAIASLKGFVQQIPGLFKTALQSLEVMDLFPPIKAFLKVAGVFGSFIGQFINWGLNAAWTLLEIIFDVVSPGALMYIKKTGAALKSILKNPLPFVGNLVKAAKLGFQNFAEHFLDHLKAGLFDWLTGSLPGIYILKAFSLVEIAKFVFSVLGLTWENIRAKLVKVVGEPAVKAMETGFDIVVTLVRDGPAAAWDKIKDQLANLKDMAIGAISDFVVDMVVKKAIPKLISMFIPGAGFISAILSIYDTVMVFVNKISQIIQVVTAFIDSIVAIAAGQIGAAAARVEKILASLLSLAINFLMGFIGLGKVADKIMGIIAKIRAPIDKAIDWLINWIVTMAKKLFAKVMGRDNETPEEKQKRLEKAAADALSAVNKYAGKTVGELILKPILAYIKIRHGLTSIEPIAAGDRWSIRLEINPVTIIKTDAKVGGGGKGLQLNFVYEPRWPLDEFESKANAMKRAAEKKKVKDVVPPDLKTVGSGKTKALRKGGQAAFREDISSYIVASLFPDRATDALVMMKQLQADHQQELQVGGTDTPENMALIESSMNASLGSQLKNAINEAKVDPDTVIDAVEIDTSKGRGSTKDAAARTTGTARKLQEHLLTASHHKIKEVSTGDQVRIKAWFKLD
jgi:uncharacterized protein DUF4157